MPESGCRELVLVQVQCRLSWFEGCEPRDRLCTGELNRSVIIQDTPPTHARYDAPT
jgi:hypothetical protein